MEEIYDYIKMVDKCLRSTYWVLIIVVKLCLYKEQVKGKIQFDSYNWQVSHFMILSEKFDRQMSQSENIRSYQYIEGHYLRPPKTLFLK